MYRQLILTESKRETLGRAMAEVRFENPFSARAYGLARFTKVARPMGFQRTRDHITETNEA
jgi:hypothetical protein